MKGVTNVKTNFEKENVRRLRHAPPRLNAGHPKRPESVHPMGAKPVALGVQMGFHSVEVAEEPSDARQGWVVVRS